MELMHLRDASLSIFRMALAQQSDVWSKVTVEQVISLSYDPSGFSVGTLIRIRHIRHSNTILSIQNLYIKMKTKCNAKFTIKLRSFTNKFRVGL